MIKFMEIEKEEWYPDIYNIAIPSITESDVHVVMHSCSQCCHDIVHEHACILCRYNIET